MHPDPSSNSVTPATPTSSVSGAPNTGVAQNLVNRSDPIEAKFFKPLEAVEKLSDGIFYACAALSLLTPFLDKLKHPVLYDWIMIVFAVAVFTLFILGLCVRIYFSPRAEAERRKDFFSNVYDVALTQETSKGFYNNALVLPMEKMAAQVLENSHFTKCGILKALKFYRPKVAIYFMLWLMCILNRQVDLGWVIAASQAVFSEQILAKWIRMEWLRMRAEKIFDDVYTLFQTKTESNMSVFAARVTGGMAEYESAKANAAITLSSKMFHENNAEWSKRWSKIQQDLKI